jgi:RNA recognition motif-containing protein
MSNKLYVGNLNYEVNSEDLKEFFIPFGEIKEASVIIDRETGRSKGFGFVEFLSDESAEKVKLEANGKELKGRALKINDARRSEKPRGGFGGGGNRGGFGGGNGNRGYGGGGGNRSGNGGGYGGNRGGNSGGYRGGFDGERNYGQGGGFGAGNTDRQF